MDTLIQGENSIQQHLNSMEMTLKLPERQTAPGSTNQSKFFRGWNELKVMGKLPERRCYHSATVSAGALYIHGGQDLKEGSHDSIWKLDLQKLISYAQENKTQESEIKFSWEQLQCEGEVP